MALNLINELPKILRKSSPHLTWSKFFKELEKDHVKCYSYAAKAISIVCQDIEKNQNLDENSLQSYTDFMIKLIKYVNYEKYEVFMLQNMRFFVYFLLKKGAERQLKLYFKEFIIKKIWCAESYRIYFDIVKNVQFYLIQKYIKLKLEHDEEIKICFNNLNYCMDVPDEENFLSFLTELFDHESSFNTICICQEKAKNLIHACFLKLKKFTISSNMESYFILITRIFMYFNKYEIISDSRVLWSIELLKNVIENKLIRNNSYQHYALTLLLYFASLRIKEFSQKNLKEILRKQLKLYETNLSSIWYYDAQCTFIELFSKNSSYILKNIEEENLKYVIEIFFNISKFNSSKIYSKENCCVCKNYKSHEIVSMLHIIIEIYEHIVKFDNNCEEAELLTQYVLNWIKKDYTNIVLCKNMEILLKNKLTSFKKIISKVNTVKMAKTAVNILDFMQAENLAPKTQDKIMLAKLYLHLYKILDDKKLILQLLAIIMNLSPDIDGTALSSYMFSFTKLLIELDMTTFTIKEILQDCHNKFLSAKYINEGTFNFLTKKQIGIIISFKLFTNDIIEYLLEKIVQEDILSNLEFVLIVRSLEQYIKSKKLQQKLEYIKEKNEKSRDDLMKFLTLSHIYKYNALKKFEESRNSFMTKITTEDHLTDLNISDFGKINIEKEFEIIEPAKKSLKYFTKILNLFDKKYNHLIDMEAVLDDLSYLARSFHLRGYMEQATNAWFLVYCFAKKDSEYELYQIRAIAFFCKYIHFNILEEYNLHLETELNSLSEKVVEYYNDLENLSPRKQNYVLLYLLNVAYYYGYRNDIKSLKSLVKMVQVKINEITERKNKLELVRAHLISLEMHFRIKALAKLDISPYIFITYILKELKEIVYITSEDSLNMSCFLIELVENIASFLLTMLDTKTIISYLAYVLSFSLQYGLTFRISKLFVTWTKISLQNGDVNNAQLKLLILEKMLLEDSYEIPVEKYFNEAVKNKRCAHNSISLEKSAEVEETRKAIQNISLTEKLVVFSEELQRKDFFSYLLNHNNTCFCNMCKLPIYKFIIFEIGYCYMQINVQRNENKTMTKSFIEKSLKWWSELNNKNIRNLFQESFLYLYLDNIKLLRKNREYSEAIDFCEIASKFLETHNSFNNNMIWKIIEHYFAIQSNSMASEMNIMSSPNIKVKTQRRLKGRKFN